MIMFFPLMYTQLSSVEILNLIIEVAENVTPFPCASITASLHSIAVLVLELFPLFLFPISSHCNQCALMSYDYFNVIPLMFHFSIIVVKLLLSATIRYCFHPRTKFLNSHCIFRAYGREVGEKTGRNKKDTLVLPCRTNIIISFQCERRAEPTTSALQQF